MLNTILKYKWAIQSNYVKVNICFICLYEETHKICGIICSKLCPICELLLPPDVSSPLNIPLLTFGQLEKQQTMENKQSALGKTHILLLLLQ